MYVNIMFIANPKEDPYQDIKEMKRRDEPLSSGSSVASDAFRCIF